MIVYCVVFHITGGKHFPHNSNQPTICRHIKF